MFADFLFLCSAHILILMEDRWSPSIHCSIYLWLIEYVKKHISSDV